MTINVRDNFEQFKAEVDNWISGREANVAFVRAYVGQLLTDIKANAYTAYDKAVDGIKKAYAWTVELCKTVWSYVQRFFAWVKGSFQSLKDRSKSAPAVKASDVVVDATAVEVK